MTYRVIKRYGHDRGLSCAFRQPRAESHCRYLHGYSLAFTFTFESEKLDNNGWVIDFGSLKPLKEWLDQNFDHRTIIAEDDPCISWFREGKQIGTMDLSILPAVGCEFFAHFVYSYAAEILPEGIRLISVRVSEHDGNHAEYLGGLKL